MMDLSTRRRNIASCLLTKQRKCSNVNHLGKCSNGKLRTSTLVNDGTLRSIVDFASALSNIKMLMILKMLRYPICLRFLQQVYFPLFVLTRKSLAAEAYTSRKLQDYENIHGGDSFLITLKSFWQKFLPIFTCNFAETYLNGQFLM